MPPSPTQAGSSGSNVKSSNSTITSTSIAPPEYLTQVVKSDGNTQTKTPDDNSSPRTPASSTTIPAISASINETKENKLHDETSSAPVVIKPIRKRRHSDSSELPFEKRIKDALTHVEATGPPLQDIRGKRPTNTTTSGPKPKKLVNRDAEVAAKVMQLPFQTIKCLNMPPRIGFVQGQPIPEPDSSHLPFGPTEDYKYSMIIHYVDELELTYGNAAERFSKKFPTDAVTDEALRKRHVRSLLRLWEKYGLKDEKDIPPLSAVVRRRGIPRAKRLSNIAVDASHSGSVVPTSLKPDVASSTPAQSVDDETPRTKRKYNMHEFEKACIVVWHDADGLGWKAIRNKLEEEHNWSLGLDTVQKHYYLSLDRVYGRGGKKMMKAEKSGDAVPAKDEGGA